MHEPFGQGCLQRPERLFGNDRLLPFIHYLNGHGLLAQV
jgi:hypothetical protein